MKKRIYLISCIVLSTVYGHAREDRPVLCSNLSDRSSGCIDVATECGLGYVHFRSQGANLARRLVGWQTEIHAPAREGVYGAVTLTYEYTRSFRAERMARALFGTPELYFAGSALTQERKPNELLADVFGLPDQFRGHARFRPRVENHIVELGLFVGLDETLCKGTYLMAFAPIVHTRWDIGICTRGPQNRDELLPGCTLTTDPLPAATSLADALSGNFAFDKKPLLRGARFPLARHLKTELADLTFLVGYDLVRDQDKHGGAYLYTVLPTGNRPRADYFYPVAGNNGHFELGAGASGHRILWNDHCGQTFGFYVDGYLSHMFSNRQCRTLDFCKNGQFSRYLLLRQFDTHDMPNGRIISATQFTTREAHISVLIKANIAFKLAYRCDGWCFDLGYEFYGHSREHVTLHHNHHGSPCQKRRYGIAGTSGLCCTQYPIALSDEEQLTGCSVITGPALSTTTLNSTYSNASIFRPTQELTPDFETVPVGAPESDTVCLTAQTATPAVGTIVLFPDISCAPPAGAPALPLTALARSSRRPRLITDTSLTLLLDTNSIKACGVLSNKLFTHISYMWLDDCGWNPHVGFGAEVEFDGNSCDHATLNQWGIWVKGGVTF